jgi:hypothetical protein
LFRLLVLLFPACVALPGKWPDWKWFQSTDAVVQPPIFAEKPKLS